MTFGEKLQYLRKEQNWTQEQLADQIGISRQSLSKWELGAATPDTEHVVRLSRLSGFLMTNNLCWLFWLLCLTLAGGLAALFRPRLQSLFGRLRHRLAHRQPSQPPAEE